MTGFDAGPYGLDLIVAGCRTRKAGLLHHSLAFSLLELASKSRVINLNIHSLLLVMRKRVVVVLGSFRGFQYNARRYRGRSEDGSSVFSETKCRSTKLNTPMWIFQSSRDEIICTSLSVSRCASRRQISNAKKYCEPAGPQKGSCQVQIG